MNKFMNKSWWVTLPVAALAVAYVALVFMPGKRKLTNLKADLEQKQQLLAASTSIPVAVASSNSLLLAASTYNRQWGARVAGGATSSSVFGDISAAAQSAGVETTRLEPEAPTQYDTLRRLPLRLECHGSLTQIMELVKGLEQLPRLLWVDSLRVERSGEDSEKLECKLKLAIFVEESGNSN